jgi:2,4-dienoyl-CoA reductase-like NADH-dependent reductase (Old Yellow Enzyme family)
MPRAARAARLTAAASMSRPPELDVLFTPFRIRNLALRNRFVIPGMQRGFMNDGAPTARMVDYMRRCAAGGVGLVISESTSPDHPSAYWMPAMGRMEPGTLAAWKTVVEAVHGEGAGFLLQIWHPGSMRKVAAGHPLASYPAWSPSGLIQGDRPNGHAMTREDLEELKRAYVQAAVHARSLGFDGIEVHSAHGYLLDQFLWAETNRREDEYGGRTLAERARYSAEIVAAIRKALGADAVISYRFSQFKEVDYGATVADSPEDLRRMLQLLRSAGVDLFNVSSRRYHKREWPESEHPDYTIAEWARSLTDAPVMTCGSVGLNVEMFANLFDDQEPTELSVERDLRFLADRVRRGTLDLVGVGRTHIANNDFVNKVRDGRFRELALFSKRVHLMEATAALEGGGFVEESRTNLAPD